MSIEWSERPPCFSDGWSTLIFQTRGIHFIDTAFRKSVIIRALVLTRAITPAEAFPLPMLQVHLLAQKVFDRSSYIDNIVQVMLEGSYSFAGSHSENTITMVSDRLNTSVRLFTLV